MSGFLMSGIKKICSARAENIDPFYKWNEQPLSVTAISSLKLKTKCIFENLYERFWTREL